MADTKDADPFGWPTDPAEMQQFIDEQFVRLLRNDVLASQCWQTFHREGYPTEQILKLIAITQAQRISDLSQQVMAVELLRPAVDQFPQLPTINPRTPHAVQE
jgi:hypothetical protein